MSRYWILPPKIRKSLKNPLGELIREEKMSREVIQKRLAEDVPIYSIGDLTSFKLFDLGFVPDIVVVDWKNKRVFSPLKGELIKRLNDLNYHLVHCKNPPGGITQEAYQAVITAIRKAEEKIHTGLIIDGEEDLLALLFLRYGKKRGYVVYGQPDQGMVIVTISNAIVNNIDVMLHQMQVNDNEN